MSEQKKTEVKLVNVEHLNEKLDIIEQSSLFIERKLRWVSNLNTTMYKEDLETCGKLAHYMSGFAKCSKENNERAAIVHLRMCKKLLNNEEEESVEIIEPEII
jgi:hypothetical protein